MFFHLPRFVIHYWMSRRFVISVLFLFFAHLPLACYSFTYRRSSPNVHHPLIHVIYRILFAHTNSTYIWYPTTSGSHTRYLERIFFTYELFNLYFVRFLYVNFILCNISFSSVLCIMYIYDIYLFFNVQNLQCMFISCNIDRKKFSLFENFVRCVLISFYGQTDLIISILFFLVKYKIVIISNFSFYGL